MAGLVIYHCRKPLTRKIINDYVITTNSSSIFANILVRNVKSLKVPHVLKLCTSMHKEVNAPWLRRLIVDQERCAQATEWNWCLEFLSLL